MLDSLMGPDRDKAARDSEEKWRDRAVCRGFLTGFCARDRSVLGGKRSIEVCSKIHSDIVREQFEAAPEAEREEYRRDCENLSLRDLEGLMRENEKFIGRARERVRADARRKKPVLSVEVNNKLADLKREATSIQERADALEEKNYKAHIASLYAGRIGLMRQAVDEVAGQIECIQGHITALQADLAKLEADKDKKSTELKILEAEMAEKQSITPTDDRDSLKAKATEKFKEYDDVMNAETKKAMDEQRVDICDICGTQYKGEADRESHTQYKVHQGFVLVRRRIEELKRKREEADKAKEEERKEKKREALEKAESGWTVVPNDGVEIRAEMYMSSEVVGCVENGSDVHGKREGKWLKLSAHSKHPAGYILIKGDTGTLLEPHQSRVAESKGTETDVAKDAKHAKDSSKDKAKEKARSRSREKGRDHKGRSRSRRRSKARSKSRGRRNRSQRRSRSRRR